MTGREINLLQPGDYIINSYGEIRKFTRIESYLRSKANVFVFKSLVHKSEGRVFRFELLRDWSLINADDSKIQTLEILYGPF